MLRAILLLVTVFAAAAGHADEIYAGASGHVGGIVRAVLRDADFDRGYVERVDDRRRHRGDHRRRDHDRHHDRRHDHGRRYYDSYPPRYVTYPRYRPRHDFDGGFSLSLRFGGRHFEPDYPRYYYRRPRICLD